MPDAYLSRDARTAARAQETTMAMVIEARVENGWNLHAVTLATAGREHAITIPSGPSGFGSAANGGELLCLAIATCYCNDVYREARQRDLDVTRVEVSAHAEFGEPGAPASRIGYRAVVEARASVEAIRELIAHADRVAEVHNTLRKGMVVELEGFEALPVA